jgi:hypothetical protein
MPTIATVKPLTAGGKEGAQATQDARQADLHRAGEDGHAEHRRQPAHLGGHHQRAEIDRRVDRHRQVARAEGPRAQRLQDRRDGERDHAQADRAQHGVVRRIRRLGDDRDEDEVDAHQAGVLQAEHEELRPGRALVDGIDQFAGTGGHLLSSGRGAPAS